MLIKNYEKKIKYGKLSEYISIDIITEEIATIKSLCIEAKYMLLLF